MTQADIVLLTGAPEFGVLSDILTRCNPTLTVVHAPTMQALEAAAENLARPARLIAFVTSLIVQPDIIGAFQGNCYNFHPAPPEYPGYRPAGFALLNNERHFGATAHKLVAEIDAGPIVAVHRFPIPARCTTQYLSMMAYEEAARLFHELAPALSQPGTILEETIERWGAYRYTKADHGKMRAEHPRWPEHTPLKPA